MAEHPIQGLMNVTMEKIHQMVDSNTIIGKPIITEDVKKDMYMNEVKKVILFLLCCAIPFSF